MEQQGGQIIFCLDKNKKVLTYLYLKLTHLMLTQILSISSILMAIYLLFIFLNNLDFNKPAHIETEYHMGCFSPDNQLNHSITIRQYLSLIDRSNQNEVPPSQHFQLAQRINYNDISKSVAKDFEKYLHQYYQIKTKNIYEQNFYRNLNLAEEKFNTCKNNIATVFNKDQFLADWNAFQASKAKYEDLKNVLKHKIERKEQQQRKISYLILDTNYSDVDEYENKMTNQIATLNEQLEDMNTKKIQILSKKAPLQVFIATNRSKLEEDEKLLDECVKNMKIINFCNDLTKELNTIKLTFSKQDIQTKIQRKKFIIDSFKNAIRNSQKIGDKEMIRISRQSLQKNQRELELLTLSIESFESFEESYCSKCSEQKIEELKASIQSRRSIIIKLQEEYDSLVRQEQQIGKQSITTSHRISQLEEERDFHINSNICVTPECQEQRSRDIKELGKVLNEMKKEVLDYKFMIEEHKIEHANQINHLNSWNGKFSQVVDCLNDKQYYQELMNRRPTESQDYGLKIKKLQNKLVKKLQALGS